MRIPLVAAVVLLGLTACGTQDDERLRAAVSAATAEAAAPAVPGSAEGEGEGEAVAEPVEVPGALVDAEGSVIGAAFLRDDGDGARVEVEVRGMSPGFHAMALYDEGDCATGGGPGDAFTAVGEPLAVLPPVLVLDGGVGGSDVLVAEEPVLQQLLADDGTALILGEAADDLRPEEVPAGSRIACAAFGDDIELDPLDVGDEPAEDTGTP